MLPMLRVMVNDITSETYQDDTLEQVICVAAFQVAAEFAEFAFVADVANVDISPDPTSGDSQNDSFVNLVCLKAACIIDNGSAAKAASQAISVKDGTSSIDLRGVLAGKLELLKRGWCSVFKDAKFDYQTQSLESAGSVVMTPFRLYASASMALREIPSRYRPF